MSAEVSTVTAVGVHCHVTVCALAIIMCCSRLSVVMSSRCIVMHGRCRMIHSGLRHVTVSIEARVTMAVAAPVGHVCWSMVRSCGLVHVSIV